MKTKIIYSILFTIYSLTSLAQTTSDALRFSQTFNGGTARFVSMGGAFGALGGDFSTLSYNPAGIGVYRSSEFTFTPSFKNRSITSDFSGVSSEDSRSRFYFDNIGFVLSFKPNKETESGLVNFNLGFGFNRTNDFYANSIAQGDNTTSSMMHYFAGLATNSNTNYFDLSTPSNPKDNYNPFLDSRAPWEAIMAWNTFLIDTIPGSGGYDYWASIFDGEGVAQKKVISTSGSTGEYVISMGANFSNKFYVGATVGITSLDYTSTITYSEDAFSNNATLPNGDKFNYFDYKQTLEISGTGYNFKLGAIYKPIEGLRLGLAIHTPTYYNLEDTYSSSIFSGFKFGTSESQTPNSRYDYHLETPFKTIASAAYVFKDMGLISVDYEHVNYASTRFRDGGDGEDYSTDNQNISNTYRNVSNIRIGGEIHLNDIFLRAGYALYANPYKKDIAYENAKRSIISGGIGYRSNNFFIDAAYQYSIQKEGYVFYSLQNNDGTSAIDPVSAKVKEGKFLVTLGFKF